MEKFSKILVTPYVDLLDTPRGGEYHRGGPCWPDWDNQLSARHLRSGVPCDVLPPLEKPKLELKGTYYWIGPIVDHYGHQVSEFISRLPRTLSENNSAKLLFSTHPKYGYDSIDNCPVFFKAILEWFNVNLKNVYLVTEPTLVDRLIVYPEEEGLGWGPSQSYLNLLDSMLLDKINLSNSLPTLFVSRAGQRARFAGEAYIESLMLSAGILVIRPERFSLIEQMQFYLNSQKIIFSEGSAVHTLQLLGRLSKTIYILNRRPNSSIAKNILMPRVSSLNYLSISIGLIHGLNRAGKAAPELGISIIDPNLFLEQFENIGISVKKYWDKNLFDSYVINDVREWIGREKMSPRANVTGSLDQIMTLTKKFGINI